MARTGSGKRPSTPHPKGQGSTGHANTQTPISGGSNADRPPGRSKSLNQSIKAPGNGTRGDGSGTHRTPRSF